MADESMIGFKAKISVNDGASSAHVLFKNVLTIMIPASEFGEYETTLLNNLDASDAPMKDRTFKSTLRDNGTVKIEGFFTKAEVVRMKLIHGVNDKEFKLTAPDPDGTSAVTAMIATFNGFLKTIGEIKLEKDKEVMISYEIRISGKVTITDAANET